MMTLSATRFSTRAFGFELRPEGLWINQDGLFLGWDEIKSIHVRGDMLLIRVHDPRRVARRVRSTWLRKLSLNPLFSRSSAVVVRPRNYGLSPEELKAQLESYRNPSA
jgi:hypothetical protein